MIFFDVIFYKYVFDQDNHNSPEFEYFCRKFFSKFHIFFRPKIFHFNQKST